MSTFEEDLDEVKTRNPEEGKEPKGAPEYAIYLGVGDLPPNEAIEYVKEYKKRLAPLFGGRSVYIPVRGKNDSRIELLQPTSTQKRAWEFFIAALAGKSFLPEELADIARGAFQAARSFAEVEAQEMKMISKPCPECGGTGEMEGMAASEIEE
jgi:hypothetical protein